MKRGAGMYRATIRQNNADHGCMTSVQRRFVTIRSTMGLHNGLMTQGR
jgi:hypothetical protein